MAVIFDWGGGGRGNFDHQAFTHFILISFYLNLLYLLYFCFPIFLPQRSLATLVALDALFRTSIGSGARSKGIAVLEPKVRTCKKLTENRALLPGPKFCSKTT